ncbi:MAG TPA: hypothetical protein VN520_14970 [Streptomyces sp.]|uniref:hypothetical protein n=1 Tax=Streptomyces sp. TaxID=1931 RepID=UPI002BFA99E1|nr:hypothetical protein [Streptomyces sp.]HWU07660.1 hypothetical protein [Streptomyces sp.]
MTPASADVGLSDTLGPTTASITRWVEDYVMAWKSNARADIEALFTDDAESHESPFDLTSIRLVRTFPSAVLGERVS